MTPQPPPARPLVIGIDASRAAQAQRTGTEGYAFHLLEALLPRLVARGHSVRLYCNTAPVAALTDTITRLGAGRRQVTLRVMPWPRLWTHLRLAAELLRRPPDVFFTPAHVIPALYRGRAVATVHDLGFHYFPAAHTRSQVAYLNWSTRHNARRSRLVIADSAETRSDLQRVYGIAPAQVHVVYPGLEPGMGPVDSPARVAAAQRKYGIRAPYLLYLGTLQPRKNLVRLVEAFVQVADAVPHDLVLAGKTGWLAQPLLDAVAQLPEAVARRIVLPGFIADGDKAALLTGATALLFPSLYEGFGFPVIEAQACGTPVLCSNTSSLPEVAGDAALLVDPGHAAALADGIVQIVHDDRLRARLRADGPVNARRFQWGDSAETITHLLEQAAA